MVPSLASLAVEMVVAVVEPWAPAMPGAIITIAAQSAPTAKAAAARRPADPCLVDLWCSSIGCMSLVPSFADTGTTSDRGNGIVAVPPRPRAATPGRSRLPARFGDSAAPDLDVDGVRVVVADAELVAPGGERPEERGPHGCGTEASFTDIDVRPVPAASERTNLDLVPGE